MIEVEYFDEDFGAYVGKQKLKTHAEDECSGEFCCIHNPSDHKMRQWPMQWRADRGLMERACEHGVGHPDPDDISHKYRTMGEAARYEAIHGCDGCCND